MQTSLLFLVAIISLGQCVHALPQLASRQNPASLIPFGQTTSPGKAPDLSSGMPGLSSFRQFPGSESFGNFNPFSNFGNLAGSSPLSTMGGAMENTAGKMMGASPSSFFQKRSLGSSMDQFTDKVKTFFTNISLLGQKKPTSVEV
ncbi:hypothetical protein O181_003539 [Austropuccinia psidii MF-1]|uniref:Secreted protein n=1 Tax=Austropuccinia psidii MF-1 TaxID=1389203 RepID=A0A9Q3GDY8_9BASI|nr:hypothetical protein [Austropuccinia psidii MF-1]